MGRVTRRHRTPGIVSTSSGGACCAAWNARMLLNAASKAAVLSASSCTSGSSCDHMADGRCQMRDAQARPCRTK